MKGLSWDQATGQKSEEGSVNELGTRGRQRGTRESLEGGRGTQGGREGGRQKVFLNELEPVGSYPPRAGVEERGPALLQAGVPQGHGQHVPKEVPKWSRQTMPQNAHFPNTALTRSQTAPTTTHSKAFTKLPLPATESANPPA